MQNNILLFDDPQVRSNLLPFTFTRPIAGIRIGIRTIREKWEAALGVMTGTVTATYLQGKFPKGTDEPALLINGSILPNAKLLEAVRSLKPGQSLVKENVLLATSDDGKLLNELESNGFNPVGEVLEYEEALLQIQNLWDIYALNGEALRQDFEQITAGRKSERLDATNTLIGKAYIFVEEGAEVQGAILNGNAGPIYIGKEAKVMEGSVIRGPFSLGEHSMVKMGAKIYGPTTVGPFSKVGGEVNNSVVFGFSNKGHDGFLGNSVIGEWCNLGADTNTSNLKNNYDTVKLWSYGKEGFVSTGKQFCGLMMGDHSKCGINTMFNTGTVVGVSANIFGSGFPRNFIPGFSWGGAAGFTTYKIDKAFETTERVMARRGRELNQTERDLLQSVFDQTAKYRKA